VSVRDVSTQRNAAGEIDSLVPDLLDWIGAGPRADSEVMEA